MARRKLSAEKIRRRLVELRWTQSDLARATGLTTAGISKIMSSLNPLISSAVLIADAIGLTVDELLEDEAEQEPEEARCSA